MISIIIPTYNDGHQLPYLLQYLKRAPFQQYITEIIIADGNSKDHTKEVAASFDVVYINTGQRSRAMQMNKAAALSSGKILYFLHPDSFPPKDFANEIVTKYEHGIKSGCFRLQFDHQHWFLKLNSWFTRFNINWFRLGGQSLFISKTLFFLIGRFSEDHMLLEEQEMVSRLKHAYTFEIIPKYLTTSARRYLNIGVYRFQAVYWYVYTLYQLGATPSLIEKKYSELMQQG